MLAWENSEMRFVHAITEYIYQMISSTTENTFRSCYAQTCSSRTYCVFFWNVSYVFGVIILHSLYFKLHIPYFFSTCISIGMMNMCVFRNWLIIHSNSPCCKTILENIWIFRKKYANSKLPLSTHIWPNTKHHYHPHTSPHTICFNHFAQVYWITNYLRTTAWTTPS